MLLPERPFERYWREQFWTLASKPFFYSTISHIVACCRRNPNPSQDVFGQVGWISTSFSSCFWVVAWCSSEPTYGGEGQSSESENSIYVLCLDKWQRRPIGEKKLLYTKHLTWTVCTTILLIRSIAKKEGKKGQQVDKTYIQNESCIIANIVHSTEHISAHHK